MCVKLQYTKIHILCEGESCTGHYNNSSSLSLCTVDTFSDFLTKSASKPKCNFGCWSKISCLPIRAPSRVPFTIA